MPGGQTMKCTILGVTGSGKSTLAYEIITELDRVLILDSMGDYEEIPGAIIVEGGDNCINKLLELQHQKRWRLVCLTLTEQEGLDILAVGFDVPDITIVVDESSLYCNPHYLPDEIARLVRYSRKRNIDLIFLARRPSEIHRELTAQSNLLVTFIQHEPIDIRYLTARMGKEKAEKAMHLGKYEILVHGDYDEIPLAILKRMKEGDSVKAPPTKGLTESEAAD